MGRGRQKAKQTKVARELKYSTYEPNLRALEQELTGGSPRGGLATSEVEDRDTDEDADWGTDRR
ncbi:DUF3073 domain-containing protein [Actinotalea sp. Marseille-Q4924]|uniref:DUF3073 domain-containing protein n=1 Tax=Actinotalea sp. Marseille-Q4924 TaxID=2866571 RepID=UPI001CE4A6B3|nr:DUF3073 domain-containing protein [Actinotalea sp. Marseille-Q4924]